MQHITKINGEVWIKEYEVALCVHQQSVTDGKVSTKERKLHCVCRSRKALRSLSGSSLIFLFNASIFSFHFRVKYLLIFCPSCLVKHFHKKALKTDFLFSEKKMVRLNICLKLLFL